MPPGAAKSLHGAFYHDGPDGHRSAARSRVAVLSLSSHRCVQRHQGYRLVQTPLKERARCQVRLPCPSMRPRDVRQSRSRRGSGRIILRQATSISHLLQGRRLGRAKVELSGRDGADTAMGIAIKPRRARRAAMSKRDAGVLLLASACGIGRNRQLRFETKTRFHGKACRSYWFPIAGRSIKDIFWLQRTSDFEMSGCRRPKQRWIGWLAAIAYLFASLTPSLAQVPVNNLVELPVVQCAHEMHEGTAGHHHHHDHHHAGAEAAGYSHDATREDCHDDQDRSVDGHAGCCGSALCLSAVSPQAPSLPYLAIPRSRCVSQPGETQHEEAVRRLYRPPIT